ncbi:glycosyltransferase [soil metagenome]
MRFVLFKGQSQYGSLRLHIDQLAAALIGLGHAAEILDLTAPEMVNRINATFADPPDCYFGMSGIGADIQSGANPIYDSLGVTYASLYVDHPVHHARLLAIPMRKKVAFFLDRSHLQFVTAWSKGRGFAQLAFLPPGANEIAPPPETTDGAFLARDIPLLFTGTYRGEPDAPWRAEPPSIGRDAVEEIAQRMVADGKLPVLDALKAVIARLGGELTPDLFEEFLPLLQAPQFYAEAHHRQALLQTLGEAGTPMHIYGNGWEPLLERYKSFVYGGVGSFEETLRLLRRTRLVLNTNNGFVNGGHERVFTAMAGGAAVLSDENRYYAEAYKPGREIATYGWDKLDSVPGQIQALLADEGALAAQARAGAKRTLADHTWTQRAAKLVKTVKQAG